MLRWIPLAILLLVGCSKVERPVVQTPPPSPPPQAEAPKGVEPVPPTNIGDASPIVFTAWHGVRKGQGNMKVDDKGQATNTPIEAVELALEPDGNFVAKLMDGTNIVKTVGGSWRKKDDKTVHLSVETADETKVDPSTGSIAFMDRANPTTFKLEFTNAEGFKYTIDFRAKE